MNRRRWLVSAGAAMLAIAAGLRVLAGPFDLAVRRARAEGLYAERAWRASDTAFQTLIRDATRRRRENDLPALAYDAGAASYRMGHFDEAVRQFRGGLAGTRVLQEWADFNLGNAFVWQARIEVDRLLKRSALRAAVGAFEDALVLDPHDADAKWNLEVALRRLAVAEDSLGGGPHRGEANWGGGNLTKAGYEGTPQTGAGASPGAGYGTGSGDEAVPQLTETQARQLLKAVERAEVTGQERGAGTQRLSNRPSHEHDW